MNMQKQKTTLYFDPLVYMEVKKKALEEGKTITEYLNMVVGQGIGEKIVKKRKFKSKLLPPMDLGKNIGDIRREEIYDYLRY